MCKVSVRVCSKQQLLSQSSLFRFYFHQIHLVSHCSRRIGRPSAKLMLLSFCWCSYRCLRAVPELTTDIAGQITTTLGALSRLIDDYDSMARKEMVTAAREKANIRVAKLKTEHRELKARFERAKADGQIRVSVFALSFLSNNYKRKFL